MKNIIYTKVLGALYDLQYYFLPICKYIKKKVDAVFEYK